MKRTINPIRRLLPAKLLLVSAFFMLGSLSLFAQVDNLLNKLADDNRLKSLTSELHPAAFLEEGTVKHFGDAPAIVLYTNAESLSQIANNAGGLESVELFFIKVSSAENNSKLDLDLLSEFSNLKYIIFSYEYPEAGEGNTDVSLKNLTLAKLKSTNNSIQILYNLRISQ